MLSVFKVLTIVAELLQYALHCGKHTLDRKKQPSLKGAEYLLGLSRKNTPGNVLFFNPLERTPGTLTFVDENNICTIY
jgi:hypothetical protein